MSMIWNVNLNQDQGRIDSGVESPPLTHFSPSFNGRSLDPNLMMF